MGSRVFKRIVSPNETRRQLAGGHRLAPGFWVDREGAIHVSVVELLAFVGLPDTEANREEVTQMAVRTMQEAWPGTPVTIQEERDH
jgi:hypothetical protein